MATQTTKRVRVLVPSSLVDQSALQQLQEWVLETFGAAATKFAQILKHSQLSAQDLHDMHTDDLLQLARLVDEASASRTMTAIERAKRNGVLVVASKTSSK